MKRPSAIAWPLLEARLLLEEAGAQILTVTGTAPPGGGPEGPLRVVRERWTAEGVSLVAAASLMLSEGEGVHV